MPSEAVDTLARIPLFAGRRLDGVSVERLGSLTNRNYKLTLDGESYVLRLVGAGTDRYIDRAAELRNARCAAAIGIAPEIVHADPQTGLLLTRFIDEGVTLNARDLREPAMLRAAAVALKRLHCEAGAFGGRMELLGKLDEYLDLAGPAAARPIHEIRGEAEAIDAALARHPEVPAPCHIDPVPQNFVADAAGRLYLLDWEYSAMCEPVWDLSGLALEADLDAAAEDILLRAYYGVPTSRTVARFALYKIGLDLLSAAWAAVQAADGNDNDDFAAMTADRLARSDAAMASPAFARQLAAATA